MVYEVVEFGFVDIDTLFLEFIEKNIDKSLGVSECSFDDRSVETDLHGLAVLKIAEHMVIDIRTFYVKFVEVCHEIGHRLGITAVKTDV